MRMRIRTPDHRRLRPGGDYLALYAWPTLRRMVGVGRRVSGVLLYDLTPDGGEGQGGWEEVAQETQSRPAAVVAGVGLMRRNGP